MGMNNRMNTALFDTAFKAFTEVRREWIQILQRYAVYINDTGDGVQRPVAVINDPEIMAQLRHLQLEWERFYLLAESRRLKKLSPLPVSLYSPVPVIAGSGDLAAVIVTQAANTMKWHRDKVIMSLEKKLAQHVKMRRLVESGALPQNELPLITANIAVFEADLKRFNAMPEGTMLVRRQSGYTDVIVKMKNEASQDEVSTLSSIFDGFVETEVIRVGAYGCVIDGSKLKYEPVIDDKTTLETRRNVYASITPVPCALMSSNASLYLLEDVNRAKAEAKQAVLEERRKASRQVMRAARGHADDGADEKKPLRARISSKAVPKN